MILFLIFGITLCYTAFFWRDYHDKSVQHISFNLVTRFNSNFSASASGESYLAFRTEFRHKYHLPKLVIVNSQFNYLYFFKKSKEFNGDLGPIGKFCV